MTEREGESVRGEEERGIRDREERRELWGESYGERGDREERRELWGEGG